MSIFNYKRRNSSEVNVGKVLKIGGNNPIVVQSMTNTNTNDIIGSSAQIINIYEAGGQLIRLTTQGEREASNMSEIKRVLSEKGYEIPLAADVHFNPAAAFKAAATCEKVRINPGNFADPVHRFEKIDFSDEEYAAELDKIRKKLVPFIETCKKYSTAIRLGVNHGSLSDRIMSRFGNTSKGMVESLMEYLRICKEEDFNDVVLSIKASNVVLMVQTVRELVACMEKEDMHYPIHLGVTEAGNENEGRIKSAAGIGALLSEGIGDTIRVSLSENPENEIPVAKKLIDYICSRADHENIPEPAERIAFPSRNFSHRIPGFENIAYPLVEGYDFALESTGAFFCDASEEPKRLTDEKTPLVISSRHTNPIGEISSWIERFISLGGRNPIVIRLKYDDEEAEDVIVKGASDFGTLLLNGYGNAISFDAKSISKEKLNDIALTILQAVRLRITKPDYIACPGCGRTLFDLEQTLAKVKAATSDLVGLKIGVMGCVVNGPGEMADADYGYVGAAPGKISLYRGQQLIRKNIPQEEAVEALLRLIEEDNKFTR